MRIELVVQEADNSYLAVPLGIREEDLNLLKGIPSLLREQTALLGRLSKQGEHPLGEPGTLELLVVPSPLMLHTVLCSRIRKEPQWLLLLEALQGKLERICWLRSFSPEVEDSHPEADSPLRVVPFTAPLTNLGEKEIGEALQALDLEVNNCDV